MLNISSKCCWKTEWGCAFDITKDDTYYISSSQFSHSVVSNSLQPHGPRLTRPPCPSPTPRVYPNSCPLSQWCHPAISSSVVPFSSCPQSFPASGSFPMSQLFAWGGQSIGVSASASVLAMNTQDWSPLDDPNWMLVIFFLSCYFQGDEKGKERWDWSNLETKMKEKRGRGWGTWRERTITIPHSKSIAPSVHTWSAVLPAHLHS